jgi:hypothetical protein
MKESSVRNHPLGNGGAPQRGRQHRPTNQQNEEYIYIHGAVDGGCQTVLLAINGQKFIPSLRGAGRWRSGCRGAVRPSELLFL